MTTKSPRRSPNRRLYDSSSYPFKTRGLWYNTSLNHFRPPNKKHSLPIYYTLTMRHNYDQFNLSSPNRPKITNCIFICKPHSPSHCSYHNSNTMKLYRSYYTNNRTWLNLLLIILLSKYQLRTNPQSNYNHSPRPTNDLSTNGHMMTFSKSSQPSLTTTNQSHRGALYRNVYVLLI